MVDPNEEEDLEVDHHQAQAVEDSFLTTHTSEKARYTFFWWSSMKRIITQTWHRLRFKTE